MRNIIKIHDANKWFGDAKTLLDYFENKFKMNTMGTFKAPASTIRRHNNLKTQIDKESLIRNIANIYIGAIQNTPKGKLLSSIDFSWLEEGTQLILKESVCEAIQHAVLNQNVWEKIKASSISTPNFSMNTDTTSWLMSSDMFGMIAKNAITNSGLGKYKIVGNGFLADFKYSDATSSTIVLHKWNNIELRKNWGDYTNSVNGITDNDGVAQRYDYFTVDKKETWRFDGDIWTRVDTKIVDENRYLVYDDYILVGSQGKDGIDGVRFQGSKATLADIELIANPVEGQSWLALDTNKLYAWTSFGKWDIYQSNIIVDKTKYAQIDKNTADINVNRRNITDNGVDIVRIEQKADDNKGLIDTNIIDITKLRADFAAIPAFGTVVYVGSVTDQQPPANPTKPYVNGDISLVQIDTGGGALGYDIYTYNLASATWGTPVGRINQLIDLTKYYTKVAIDALLALKKDKGEATTEHNAIQALVTKNTNAIIVEKARVTTNENEIKLKADKADVYLKTETYNQTEIDNKLSGSGTPGAIPHYKTTAERDSSITSPTDKEQAYVGTDATGYDIWEWSASAVPAAWVLVGHSKHTTSAPAKFGDGTDISTQSGAAYSKTESDAKYALKGSGGGTGDALFKTGEKVSDTDLPYTKTEVDTAISNKQDDLGVILIAGGKLASANQFTSDDETGARNVPVEDKDLTDVKFVRDEIEPVKTIADQYVDEKSNYITFDDLPGVLKITLVDQALVPVFVDNGKGNDDTITWDVSGENFATFVNGVNTEVKFIKRGANENFDIKESWNDASLKLTQISVLGKVVAVKASLTDSAFVISGDFDRDVRDELQLFSPIVGEQIGANQAVSPKFKDGSLVSTQPRAITLLELQNAGLDHSIYIDQATLDAMIGVLANLTTIDISSLVAALNEINGKVDIGLSGTAFKGVFGTEGERDAAILVPNAGDIVVIRSGGAGADNFQINNGSIWQNLNLQKIYVEVWTNQIYNSSTIPPVLKNGESNAIWVPLSQAPTISAYSYKHQTFEFAGGAPDTEIDLSGFSEVSSVTLTIYHKNAAGKYQTMGSLIVYPSELAGAPDPTEEIITNPFGQISLWQVSYGDPLQGGNNLLTIHRSFGGNLIRIRSTIKGVK